jgi:hypothetical protein
MQLTGTATLIKPTWDVVSREPELFAPSYLVNLLLAAKIVGGLATSVAQNAPAEQALSLAEEAGQQVEGKLGSLGLSHAVAAERILVLLGSAAPGAGLEDWGRRGCESEGEGSDDGGELHID